MSTITINGKPAKKSPNQTLLAIDQLVATLSDYFLVSHPLEILRLQCQANSRTLVNYVNPFSAMSLYSNQLREHGIGCYTKGLQTHCAYLTIESIFHKILVESISELSGVDLNLGPSIKLNSLTAIKYSFSSYALNFLSEILKIVGLTSFNSSNKLIKVASLFSTPSERPVDYTFLIEFFKVAFRRIFFDNFSQGYNDSAFSFGQLIVPTLLSIGTEALVYSLLNKLVSYVYDLAVYGDDKEVKPDLNSRNVNSDEFSSRATFYRNRYIHLITWCLSKILTYKFEVVSTKMHVQGTRILVDDTTIGYGVVPVETRFSSFWNTWQMTSLMDQNMSGVGFVYLDFVLRVALAYGTSQLGRL